MSTRKQATFTDEEFERAMKVADYENHTFSRFIVHCVNKETDKRFGDAMAKLSKDEEKIAPGPLPGPGAALLDSITELESLLRGLEHKFDHYISKERLPTDQS